MSFTTVLLAFAPAIFRPKAEPEKSDREIKLEERVEALEAEIEHARRRNDELRAELADSRAAFYRATRHIDEMRAVLGAPPPRLPPNAYAGQQYAGQAALQQACMLQAQNAQAFYQGGLQQLGTQQNAQQNVFGELVDCTGGGRARHLVGLVGMLGDRT